MTFTYLNLTLLVNEELEEKVVQFLENLDNTSILYQDDTKIIIKTEHTQTYFEDVFDSWGINVLVELNPSTFE